VNSADSDASSGLPLHEVPDDGPQQLPIFGVEDLAGLQDEDGHVEGQVRRRDGLVSGDDHQQVVRDAVGHRQLLQFVRAGLLDLAVLQLAQVGVAEAGLGLDVLQGLLHFVARETQCLAELGVHGWFLG